MRSHGNKIVEPPTASPKPMTGPHFGMIPRRVAKLRLPGRVHAVLDVIACHANPKKGNRAYLRRDTIANEAGIDCSKVSFCTRWLEKNGLVEISGRGGRGLANTYRIIPDAEAVTPAAATTAAENGADDGTVSNQNGAENGAVSGKNGADFGQNGAKNGTTTESEQKERTAPPSGESRAREGDRVFFDDGVDDEKQGVLLPPINGGGDRMAPLKRYNPSAELVDWAAELGVNALADGVLGEFIDYHLDHDKLPADIEAAYRRWVRREQRFAERDAERFQSRPRQRSNAAEAEAAFDDALRQSRANGAGND
jgi:hypothetical protein